MDTQPKWTWADLVSSYQFWALTIFFVAIAASSTAFVSYFPLFSLSWRPDWPSERDLVPTAYSAGMMPGMLLAWTISRYKHIGNLHALSVLFVVGAALACLSNNSQLLMLSGYFLIGLTVIPATLLMPAFIGQATGKVESYVLGLGIFVLLKTLSSNVPSRTAAGCSICPAAP